LGLSRNNLDYVLQSPGIAGSNFISFMGYCLVKDRIVVLNNLTSRIKYGYNRDWESLPQINLSLILDRDKGIPVMYEIFSGSISDVSTLSGTLKKIRSDGIQNYVAVMDCGFFSLSNLSELMTNKISFIMTARLQLTDLKHQLTEAQKDTDDVKYLHKSNKDTISA
jgi:transposase